MKKITGLLVILVVVVLGSYYSMGYLTERNVKQTIANLNQVNGLFADIEQYKRGWFTAEATINWNFHVPERVAKTNGESHTVPAQDYSIQVPLNIYHGPIIFSDSGLRFGLGYAHASVKLPEKYAKQLDELFTVVSERPKLSLSLFVSYLNNTDVKLGVPAFKLAAKDGDGEIEWQGMSSTTALTGDLNKIKGEFNIEGFRLSREKTEISLNNFNTSYNLYHSPAGLLLGTAGVSLPSFVISSGQNKVFAVDEFSLTTKNEVKADLFNSSLEASLTKLVADGKNYGPGRLEIFLRNLDAEVLAKINAQAAAAQGGTDAERRQALLATLPELPKLFGKGPELEIKELTFTFPQGTIEGHMLVSMPEGDDSANPFQMIQKIKGNGKLSIPEEVLKEFMRESAKKRLLQKPDVQQALIQQMQKNSEPQPDGTVDVQPDTEPADLDQLAEVQVKQNLEKLTQTGLLVKQDSVYVVEFNLEDGKFTVNGKPFNPAMLTL